LRLAVQGRSLRLAVRSAIQPALERARTLMPVGVDAHRTYKGRLVQPGFARRSIRAVVSVSRDKKTASAILGVKAEAFYAAQFVELGTSKTPAKPWLRPAFRATQRQQEATVAASLRNSIEDAARTR
jgi:HK97 gp10 family phage protein